MKIFIPFLLPFLFFFYPSVKAQYSVDWGKYMNEPIPNSDFSKEDQSQQLAVDIKNSATHEEYAYVVGRSHSGSGSENYCGSDKFVFGSEDAYIAKYDRCGNLVWFHFIGTDNDVLKHECGDFGVCLALDKDPITGLTVIYVGGYSYTAYDPVNCTTCSPCNAANSIPAVSCTTDPCVFQDTKKSEIDAFVVKYSETGEVLKWTYFGGDGDDYIIGMSVFKHDLFITGTTNSLPNFLPASTAKFDSTLSSESDAFIGQLDANLCKLKFFSYMGGPLYERTHSIRCFKTNDVPAKIELYVSGATEGDMGDLSYMPLNSYKGGLDDAFLSLWKFDKPSNKFIPQWTQYIGGKSDDRDREMIVDKFNNAIITGFTQSKNFITSTPWSYPVGNFYDTSFSGIKDVFLTKYNPAGTPVWGTYYGGSQNDEARGIASYTLGGTNGTRYVAISGGTKSLNLPVDTVNLPFESILNGGGSPTARDAFVAILTDPYSTVDTQKLEFASYLGGKKDEWNEALIDYGPDLELGANKEIYVTLYGNSTDLESNISSSGFHYNTNTGTDNDGYIAKILNSNIPNQFNCTAFNWGTQSPLKEAAGQFLPGAIGLFPNPATNQLNVVIAEPGRCDYQILNMMGRQMISGAIDAANTQVDISSLVDGVYIMECRVEGKFLHSQFIVAR
jgi:hypothetical protein